MAPPPITLRQITADTLPALQELYDASSEYFIRHSGHPSLHEQAAIVYSRVLEDGERVLLGIWWEQETLVGCFDLRFGHPSPNVVWFGALILRDQSPTEHAELETWSVQILEEWLRIGTEIDEIRIALMVSDFQRVHFWSQRGYSATNQSHRREIDGKRQRFVVYRKQIPHERR